MRTSAGLPAALGGIVSLCLASVSTAATPDSLIVNGTFETWDDGLPTGWTLGVGARTGGDAPASLIERIEGPGVRLRGDSSTRLWHVLGQRFPVKPRTYYRIRFEARTADLNRQGNQYDNCYVGLLIWDAAGQRLAIEVRDLFETDWARGQLVVRAPQDAQTGEAMIFLSKTGRLEVRNVRVERLRPEDSYQVLVDDMDRYYSFFAQKKVDWRALAARYRMRAEAAETPADFVAAIQPMLADLKDVHVTIRTPDGQTLPSFTSGYRPNFDFDAMARKLQSRQEIGRLGLIGRTAEGYGVVTVGTMTADDAAYQQLEEAVEGLFDAPGIILDLRANGGGAEPRAQQIAAMFADQPRVYARSKVRAGNAYSDFREQPARSVQPRQGKTYTGPIVCLIGPGCVSSGEAFALMMKALPHATLVGQPTRGASGNPAPVLLPNGVTVFYSRWVSLLPDGTVLEGAGVPPEVRIGHEGPGDPTFDAAVEILGKRIKEQRTGR
jgi:hypothetical protein